MSLSREARNCDFCTVGKGIYSCPKCNKKYCSSYCYKSRTHESCSEIFFREWVEQTMQEKGSDTSDRDQMLHILHKFENEFSEDPADEAESSDLEDRFAGLNVNDADESVIWNKLNDEEKAEFKSIVDDPKLLETILAVKQPWWTISTLNLVSEIGSEEVSSGNIASCPPYPLYSKKLSELTTVKPSNCIQYNLLNILYSYAFLCRFYNFEFKDLLEDVVSSMLSLTPVMSSGKNYSSLEESLQDSIRLIDSIDTFEVPFAFTKSIVNDVNLILQGPKNAKPSTYTMCALHDIKLLFTELQEVIQNQNNKSDKQLKKELFLSVKKIEFYLSWTLEYESTLKDISSDLVLIMLPDMVSDSSHYEENYNPPKEKPLIEEIIE